MSFSTTIHRSPQFFQKEPLLPSIVTQSTSQKFCLCSAGLLLITDTIHQLFTISGDPALFLLSDSPEWTRHSGQTRKGWASFPVVESEVQSHGSVNTRCVLQSCKMTGLAGVWTAGEWGMRIQEPSVMTSMKLLCKLPRLFWGTVGDNAREAALHTGRALGKC